MSALCSQPVSAAPQVAKKLVVKEMKFLNLQIYISIYLRNPCASQSTFVSDSSRLYSAVHVHSVYPVLLK